MHQSAQDRQEQEEACFAAVQEWKFVSSQCLSASSLSTEQESSSAELWCNLRDATVQAAREALGKQRRCQPDWYAASTSTLEPALAHRNAQFHRWLANPTESNRRLYVTARAQARAAVKQAKATWFKDTAADAQRGKFGQKHVWDSIRALQTASRGLTPHRSSTVKKVDGTVCSSPQEQLARWREHFLQVLNIPSTFSEDEIGQLRQRDIYHELAEPPQPCEIEQAI